MIDTPPQPLYTGAHVSLRTVAERDGKVWIDLNIHCEAKKEACDQLVRDFQVLNDRIKEQMSGRK